MVNRSKSSSAYVKGFTLLELLIAMAIFSVISYITFSGIRQISQQGAVLLEQDTRLSKLQRMVTIMENDFLQMAHRPVRDEDGTFLPAMLLKNGNKVEFSREGHGVLDKLTKSSLQRVQYFFEDNIIYRKTWANLDRAIGDVAVQTMFLDKVNQFKVEFLGVDTWVNIWPERTVCGDTSGKNSSLPRTVKFTIDMLDFGIISKIIPGVSIQDVPAGCSRRFL